MRGQPIVVVMVAGEASVPRDIDIRDQLGVGFPVTHVADLNRVGSVGNNLGVGSCFASNYVVGLNLSVNIAAEQVDPPCSAEDIAMIRRERAELTGNAVFPVNIVAQ
jgi:hypothetical protein